MHPLETMSHVATGLMGVQTCRDLLAGPTGARLGPFVVKGLPAKRPTGMSGFADAPSAQIDGVGIFASANATKIAIGNPNNLNELTWIDATIDAKGNFVSNDPNHNLTIGLTAQQSNFRSVALGVALGAGVVLLWIHRETLIKKFWNA